MNSSKIKQKKPNNSPFAIAGSIFAMFFGAGNAIFPLVVGMQNYQHLFAACGGMLISSVCVPLLGLVAILLYSGDYRKFFNVIGKTPGLLLICLILCLIGPFGGIPRAIAISYSTLHSIHFCLELPSLPVFSLFCCICIFFFSSKLANLANLLGNVFSPIMLLSLIWTIIAGHFQSSHPPTFQEFSIGAPRAFLAGLSEGFNTMDLLASFFFCSILLTSLQELAEHEAHPNMEMDGVPEFHKVGKKAKKVFYYGFLLSSLALASIYLGFSALAARHAGLFLHLPKGEILGHICHQVLGNQGFIPGIGVFVACLTTEIALVGIFADFLSRTLLKRTSFSFAVILTLIPSYLVSILNFDNISSMLLPILQICYPALIGLTISNILNKLFGFKYSGLVFYLILTIEIVSRYL